MNAGAVACEALDLRELGIVRFEMRAMAVELERRVAEDLPALPDAREYLRRFLALPVLDDPVLRLHELSSAEMQGVTLLSPHGWRYESPMSVVARAEARNHP